MSKRLIGLVDSFKEGNMFLHVHLCMCLFFLNDIKNHLSRLPSIESADEMVTWNVYQWIINFNIVNRHAHEVVKCIVGQWSIGSDEGSDVKGMVVIPHSRQTTSETKGTVKEPSGN